MNIYIWQNIEWLTTNWHNEGGATIIAKSLQDAREKLPKKCNAQTQEPSYTAILDKSITTTKEFIFPNAGCC